MIYNNWQIYLYLFKYTSNEFQASLDQNNMITFFNWIPGISFSSELILQNYVNHLLCENVSWHSRFKYSGIPYMI